MKLVEKEEIDFAFEWSKKLADERDNPKPKPKDDREYHDIYSNALTAIMIARSNVALIHKDLDAYAVDSINFSELKKSFIELEKSHTEQIESLRAMALELQKTYKMH